jgi:NTE family protein
MTNRILISFFILTWSFALFGQDTTQSSKPKIGVVLSGGGAKGIAHIGVLKALERAGIRPDYIVGTSMGAVIGGLYAMGYSADTLQKIVETIEWDQVLSNKIPLNYIAYEEKYYYDRYLVNFPIEGFKPTLPNGLIDGQMLSELLSDYTWTSSKYTNFDEFPIPFRCVATDVSTGKQFVFKDGPLVRAMRSSMAIPTAFTSVDVDTTLFVDGGIVNNFPVELIRELGADIVIGVNVSSSGFEDAKTINNIPGILMQMAMINSLEKLPKQIADCDIYIEPELTGYSTASFSSYKEILEVGDQAGEKFYPEFKALANEHHLTDTLYKGIAINPDAIVISKISIVGNKLTPDYVIMGKLGIKEGDLVTREMVEIGVRSVFGLNNFYKVTYYIDKIEGENVYELKLKAKEKTPATLLASVHYDNTFSAGIILNLTLRNILLKGSRAVISGDISENPKIRLDYLKYLGRNQHFAINTIYNYKALQIPAYENGEIKDYSGNTENELKLKAITTHSLKYSFGFGYEFLSIVEKSKFFYNLPEGVSKTRRIYNSLKFSYFRNSQDNRNFPTKGSATEVILNAVFKSDYKAYLSSGVDTIYISDIPISGGDLNEIVNELEPSYFFQLYANNYSIKNFNPKFQMIPSFSAGFVISTDDEFKSYDNYGIGGSQRIEILDTRSFGLNFSEINAPNFAQAGLAFQNVLWKSLFIQYGVNAMAYYSYVPIDDLASIDWDYLANNNTMIGYGLLLRYKSFIGPISFGVSRNTQDSYFRFYFQLGYSFGYSD